jgi:hypothetical protein
MPLIYGLEKDFKTTYNRDGVRITRTDEQAREQMHRCCLLRYNIDIDEDKPMQSYQELNIYIKVKRLYNKKFYGCLFIDKKQTAVLKASITNEEGGEPKNSKWVKDPDFFNYKVLKKYKVYPVFRDRE